MAPNAEPPRQQLLNSLQGCNLYIPDLQALLERWPQYVNPELERLQKHVAERLERCEMSYSLNFERLLANVIIMKPISRR